MALHMWPALTLAVENQWGGPDSADKRDWFAGAVAELFPDLGTTTTTTALSLGPTRGADAAAGPAGVGGASEGGVPDVDDVRHRMLQVMSDEFEVAVEDGSEREVAEALVRLYGECGRGEVAGVDALRRRWEEGTRRGANGGGAGGGAGSVANMFKRVEDPDQDTDWESAGSDDDDEEEEDEGGDVRMDDVPEGPSREKKAPEVDEDGFTKVTRKKR